MTDDAPRIPDHTATLTAGARIPLLGFGTWQITGQEAVDATSAALEAGYRHLDTATVYGNEGEVGRALADSAVPRDDVFVTTKCPPGRAGRELDTLRESLELLQTDHVDLWLIHWPGEGAANADMWRAFVEAREAGLAREDRVTSELALDHGLDGAADEHDPERGVADLRAERRGGDELAGSDDRRREHDTGPDPPQRGDERRRRGLDGAARQGVGILGRSRVNG